MEAVVEATALLAVAVCGGCLMRLTAKGGHGTSRLDPSALWHRVVYWCIGV
jgi:hypothetical protein